MALVTLCPDCGTTFRVRAAQLQAHGGKVCCGQCKSVFNGFSTLITVDESEIINSSQSVDQSSVTQETEMVSANYLSANSNDNDNLASSSSPDWIDEDIEGADDFNPFDQESPENPPRVWMLASLFLMLLLIGQAVYVFRMELAEIVPDTRPYLEKYCAFFSCTLPFPQQINLLSIETSDLKQNPADESDVLTLTTTIRNHAAFPLALPQLKFSLTDIHDQILASRILSVQDYLLEDADTVVSIQPHQEINIKMYFDGSNLDPAGYRLLLMYL